MALPSPALPYPIKLISCLIGWHCASPLLFCSAPALLQFHSAALRSAPLRSRSAVLCCALLCSAVFCCSLLFFSLLCGTLFCYARDWLARLALLCPAFTPSQYAHCPRTWGRRSSRFCVGVPYSNTAVDADCTRAMSAPPGPGSATAATSRLPHESRVAQAVGAQVRSPRAC